MEQESEGMNEIYCPECQEYLGSYDPDMDESEFQEFVCRDCRIVISIEKASPERVRE